MNEIVYGAKKAKMVKLKTKIKFYTTRPLNPENPLKVERDFSSGWYLYDTEECEVAEYYPD